jgi:hypothetical protein
LAPYGYAHSTQAVAQVSEAGTKLGSIKGRVLSDGQAVTNASVRVSSVNSPRQYRAVPTNDNGDFEVKGLESGMYRVQASAPAYVSLPVEPDEEIHRVGDSVTVNMIRGGVITGKVLTTDDEPLVAVRVRAMMIRDASGRRPTSTMPSMERLTDDRGNYRIFGLLPGTYVVYAGGRGFSGTGANAYDNDAPTFAPSSTRDTAEEISLTGGEERTADIRYRGSAGHSVSGKVNAPTTPNSPWIEVNLARVVNSTLDFRVSTFQNAGAKGFEFQGVADGDYSIWSQYASSTGETLVSETKRITVKGADVTGIELIARPLASVAGVIVLEPSTIAECKDKRRPLFEETLVSVQRTKSEPRKEKPARDSQLEPLLHSSSQASPDGTGSFQLRNLGAGQYDFKLQLFARYWYLRSIRLSASRDSPANDLARNSLTLKAGDRVTGLKATLTEGAASISGQVESSEQRPSGRMVFYVVPAEKDKAEEVLRYFAAPVEADGSFSMGHIPPGRYWTLVKLVTPEDERRSDALRLPAFAAARVRLRRDAEAAKSEIDLKPCQSVRDHTLPLTSN